MGLILFLSGIFLSTAAQASTLWIEGLYGRSQAPLRELNSYRQNFKWDGTTSTQGVLKNPEYMGLAVSHQFFLHTMITVRYEAQSVVGQATPISGSSPAYQVTDTFIYEPLFVLIELPVHLGNFTWSLGAGPGYALTFQFHQHEDGGNGENVMWKANPTGYRARTSLAYRLGSHFAIFAEAYYEAMKSGLKAYADYTTTINGTAIRAGQDLEDPITGQKTQVDMSGLRYGVGLRFLF